MAKKMGRYANRRRAGQRAKVVSDDRLWTDVNLRIQDGQFIPIISNSVRHDRIFDINYNYMVGYSEDDDSNEEELDEEDDDDNNEELLFNPEFLTVSEEVAVEWAYTIDYPMPDKHLLARVAIFNEIVSADLDQAKRKYLDFLKNYLLYLAEEDPVINDAGIDLESLKTQAPNMSFADLATELDYPRYDEEHDDPLYLLAHLPLPIYITTSYHDFMERSLQKAKKRPRSQLCLWSDDSFTIAQEHQIPEDFRPTVDEPLVYHLYGLERYPESLVLSEDDFMKFLVKISQDSTDITDPIIPMYLWEKLAESSLLLLGYRLEDWEFRVLFQGIIEAKHSSLRRFSLAIQLDPAERKGITKNQEIKRAQKYLKAYFNKSKSKFQVTWDSSDGFMKKLATNWNQWRKTV